MKIAKDVTTGNWMIDGKAADARTSTKLDRIQAIMEKIQAITNGRNQHGNVL